MTRIVGAIFALAISVSVAHAQQLSVITPGVPAPAPAASNGADLPANGNGLFGFGSNPCSSSGFYAGGGAYFLKPYFSSNPAYISSVGTNNQAVQEPSFTYNFGAAPVGWLGWTSDSGVGIRGRFFSYDGSSGTLDATNLGGAGRPNFQPPAAIPFSGPGTASFNSPGVLLNAGIGKDVLTFSSGLRIDTADLEATWHVENNSWVFLFGAGGRYLSMNQNYNATLANNSAQGNEADSLNASHNFNGGGPMFSLDAKYRVGQSNLWLFGIVRGSLLVGTSSSSTAFSQSVTSVGALLNQTSNPSARTSGETMMPVAEVEFGLEYGWALGRTHWFVRGAVVNQTYFDAGSASSSTGNLSLFGAQVTLGLSF